MDRSARARPAADRLTRAERMQKIRPMNWQQQMRSWPLPAASPAYGALFVLLAKTRLRPEEAFALKPDDLDLRERVVRAERLEPRAGEADEDLRGTDGRSEP